MLGYIDLMVLSRHFGICGFGSWFFLVSILQGGDWGRVSTPSRHYFYTYITTTDRHLDSVQQALLDTNL